MKNVNAKLYAIIYTLIKVLNKKLEEMKKAINEGAKITFQDYANIKIVNCTKTTLDKTKVQELCNKYGIDIKTLENTTNYTRIDIDNIDNSIIETANNIFNTLENNNDKTIARVASKITKQGRTQ